MAKTAIITRTYQDHAISYSADGWFNATEAAAKFGKSPYEWQRLPDTVAYVAALERKYGKIPYSKSKRGAGGGTWLHSKLAVNFARWLDVDFAVWCDEQIDGIIRGKDDWRTLRHTSASTNKMVNAILQMTRAEAGKDTQHFHYANEAKLINWALCGEFIGLNRENLTSQELDMLAHLEERNAILLGRGLTREQRQPMLKQYAMDWRMKRDLLLPKS
jgi:hypothetical protein